MGENAGQERLPRRPAGIDAVIEDLEQQAAGMALADLDAELVDRAHGEYARVIFSSRVHASLGHRVALALSGGLLVEGRLADAGQDWCLVSRAEGSTAGRAATLVRTQAVVSAEGLSPRAVPEEARGVTARLGFGSALRRLSADHGELRFVLVDGRSLHGRAVRVGADFVEIETPRGGGTTLVRCEGVAAVRG